jgi:hypothetical protein
MHGAQRDYTSAIGLDSALGVFQRDYHPLYSTMPQLAGYFHHSIKEEGKAPKTVRKIRLALKLCLKISLGVSISIDPTISALLRGLDREWGMESQGALFLTGI